MSGWKIALFLTAGLSTPSSAQRGQEPASVYDRKTDARVELSAAQARAAAENRQVLVVWGASKNAWCARLQLLFERDADVARKLLYEYDVVHVDVGGMDKNMELATSLGVGFEKGIPHLTILDPKGFVLAQQETGALQAGSAYDGEKVVGFLKRFQAPYPKAVDVRNHALRYANASGKRLLVNFTAPWGTSKRFELWMARPEVQPLLAKHLVIQKLDVDRTLGGQELLDSYGGVLSGLPWFVFLDAQGKALGTSSEGGWNLGCPTTDAEIASFGGLLRRVAPGLPPEDWSALARSLKAYRAELAKAERVK